MGMDRALAQRAAASPSPARSRVRRARAATRIAVAVHDVEPATFERCALIRDWLDDHGVDRVTLLVIPARDLHPLGARSPQMASWLNERARSGDAIAQHGFHHERPRTSGFSARAALRPERVRCAEFLDLDEREAKRAVGAGWRVLKLAGVEPSGFVAPAYAYTSALVSALSPRFRWWAGLWRLHDPLQGPREHTRLAPAWGMGSQARLARVLSPPLIRLGALLCGDVLRLDVYPSDLQHPRQVMALEWALRHNHSRHAVTYDELIDGERLAFAAAPAPAPRVPQPL
jgi:predicted deacetylase